MEIARTVETGDVEKLKEFLESGTKDKSDSGKRNETMGMCGIVD